MNAGKNRSGTQRCFCTDCKKYYTLNPKTREYPEEVRQQAIKTYYAGVSGRGVGKIFGFSKANVYNLIKKTAQNLQSSYHILELDELYWFVDQKAQNRNTRKHLHYDNGKPITAKEKFVIGKPRFYSLPIQSVW